MENDWFLYASLAGLLIGINTAMNNYFMNIDKSQLKISDILSRNSRRT